MNNEIHVCIDKLGGEDIYQRAAQKPDPSRPIAVETKNKWPSRTTLKIKFLEGDQDIIRKVKEKFSLWLDYVKTLKFEYVTNGNADVRIAFKTGDGSWSYIGQEVKNIGQDEPTMNYGWFDSTTPDAEIERVAVHEMGHTLGFIHEQSQPQANIDWDEDAVYEYFEASQGWDRDTTYHNVLERYKQQLTQYTQYDPTSIMHYFIPAQLLKSRREIKGGDKLSELDKQFAKKLYSQ